MQRKKFFTTLAITLVLLAIVLSPRYWGSAPAADADYYDAVNAVTAKCGQNLQLLGVLMIRGITKYAFTHGTCGLGAINEYVEMDYDFQAHSVSSTKIYDFRYVNDYFDFSDQHQPISLLDWTISSKKVFQILSRQHELEGINDFLPSERVGMLGITGALMLRQEGNSLIWQYVYSNLNDVHIIKIDATSGLVLSDEPGRFAPLLP